MIPKEKIKQVQTTILSWYETNKRDLPWRKTRDPYRILISEAMLQQTQVDRVIPYYTRFLDTYPNFSALAKADNKTLLSLWSGLGYNSRALRLKKLAQTIVAECKGIFPQTEAELLDLPGIGPYTANAILAFAFNKDVPVIDTNIRRVLIHELGLSEDISADELKQIALQTVPTGKSCIWHNALMDYGALHMTARKTGIKPLSKQPKFAGSERQIRGKIVKFLVKESPADYGVLKAHIADPRFDAIIARLQKDGLIKQQKNTISL